MPTRKQRRRREKLKRHEWEEVYVDEEGRELAPEEVEGLVLPTRSESAKGSERKGQQRQVRQRRPIEPPSLQRTLRRGLIFFPLMLVTVFLLAGDDVSTAGKITQTVVLMAFFLPFSYFMDRFMWRAYERRLSRDSETKKS